MKISIKKYPVFLLICMLLQISLQQINAQTKTTSRAPSSNDLIPTKEALDARMKWFDEARFGMFIHWGVSSTLNSTWNGKYYGGYSEHIQRMARITQADYMEKVVKAFNPKEFNADEWVSIAKATGMKYMVINAKHHDGFAMYDSKASNYNIVKATPYAHDPIRDLSIACKKAGIRFGLYYSHAFDWGEVNGPGNDWEYNNPGGDKLLGGSNWWEKIPEFLPRAQQYVDEKSIPQILELIQNYNPDLLWFDTSHKLPEEENIRILAAIRKVAPNIIVNGRESKTLAKYDYANTWDCPSEFKNWEGYWEGIPTTNGSFGFNANDNKHKPASHFIQLIAKAAARGGNILMNIGPMGNGKFDQKDINILNGISTWWKVNGESSIRGTKRTPLAVHSWGESTVKGDTVFLHVFKWPSDKKIIVGGLKTKVIESFLLTNKIQKLKFKQDGNNLTLHVPAFCPDTIDAVIVVRCNGVPQADKQRLLTTNDTEDQLRVFDAQISGGITFAGERNINCCVLNFSKPTSEISWSVRLNKATTYQVIANYAAPAEQKTAKLVEGDAGKELQKNLGANGIYAISAGKVKITHAVSNGIFVCDTVGIITLPKGEFDLKVTAEKIIGKELFRLRSIILKINNEKLKKRYL
jgi:alpha-L-fucosidase